MSRIPLILKESDEPDAPPVHAFPDGYQPYHLLKHDGRLFVGNWGVPSAGNIAIINPEARAIEGIIELDKYEQRGPTDGRRLVQQYPPGNIACADGKLFVGQVFSDFVLVIDIETQSIIKRVAIPGGGEGAIAASPDGRHVYSRATKFLPSLSLTAQHTNVQQSTIPKVPGAAYVFFLIHSSPFSTSVSSVVITPVAFSLREGVLL